MERNKYNANTRKTSRDGEHKKRLSMVIAKRVFALTGVVVVAFSADYLVNHDGDFRSIDPSHLWSTLMVAMNGISRSKGEAITDEVKTLSTNTDLSPFTDVLGNKFSFIQPFITGYESIDTTKNNCQTTKIYYDPKTDIDYVMFNFDNSSHPFDSIVDLNISYNNSQVMTNRQVELPSYPPNDGKTFQVDCILNPNASHQVVKSAHNTLPIDQVITNDPKLIEFAKDITTPNELIQKLHQYFWLSSFGYVAHPATAILSDIDTFEHGGECLDMAYLTASIAQKSKIDGLIKADVVLGTATANGSSSLHAIAQIKTKDGLYYIDPTLLNSALIVGNVDSYVDSDFIPLVDNEYSITGSGKEIYQNLCKEYGVDLSVPPVSYKDIKIETTYP